MSGDDDGPDLDVLAQHPDRDAVRAFEIHEAMMRWLLQTYPKENPVFIAVACTYEIGRIINVVGTGLDAEGRAALAESIMGIMRDQIQSGLTR